MWIESLCKSCFIGTVCRISRDFPRANLRLQNIGLSKEISHTAFKLSHIQCETDWAKLLLDSVFNSCIFDSFKATT